MTTAAPARSGAHWPDAVREALAMPRGAAWHRVALQVNPFAYRGSAQPSTTFSDEESYNRAIVDACHAAGIDLIAVTDHWSVRTADGLIGAAEAAGIVALPGFEAVSDHGIHLLVLFERGTEYSAVDAAIGACGATPGCDAGTLGNSFEQIVECMTDRQAAVVPAHVNVDNGLLTVLQGQALVRAWRNERVHAVCVSPGREVSTLHRRILDNAETEYRRQHPVSLLHSDDISDPARLASEEGSCWVKMSAPSLRALGLATRTPETRVRLVDPRLAAPAAIESISWEGGFLDGVRVRLSDSLTCLVGGGAPASRRSSRASGTR